MAMRTPKATRQLAASFSQYFSLACRVRLKEEARGAGCARRFFLEAVDHHRRGVGQLVAHLPKQLLADQLAGEDHR